jgi:hypothetical protein
MRRYDGTDKPIEDLIAGGEVVGFVMAMGGGAIWR